MCQVLGVSRGGYYAWLGRPESKRNLENKALLIEIERIYRQFKGLYGSPRITDELHDQGICASRPRVARLMKAHGIVAVTKKKFKAVKYSKHDQPVSPNLLEQDFSAGHFGQVWTSDITYIWTSEGWLYLTVLLDLFNRQIVGWAFSSRMRAKDTVIPALKMAYDRYRPPAGLIFHSDRGSQYASKKFRKLLFRNKMIQSMSASGNCYDNAVTESFFATLKKECVYLSKYCSRKEARQSIFEYIEIFYNRIRKHSTLGNKSPIQFLKIKKAA